MSDITLSYRYFNGTIDKLDLSVKNDFGHPGKTGFPNDCSVFPVVYIGTLTKNIGYSLRSVDTMFRYKKPGYRIAAFMYIENMYELETLTRQELEYLKNAYDECTLVVSPFPDAYKAILGSMPGIRRHVPFVPELLPDAQFALYLDCDTLVLSDIKESFGSFSSDMPVVSASRDPFSKESFSTGVTLFNLDKARNENFLARAVEYGRAHRGDDVINALWHRELEVSPLPYTLDFKAHGDAENLDPSLMDTIRIMHYNGRPKMWERGFSASSVVGARTEYEDKIYVAGFERFRKEKLVPPCSNR